MNYFRGLVTFGSVGLVTPNVGFQPIGYRITYAQRFGVTDTVEHEFVGGSDGTRQHVVGHFNDSTGRQQFIISGRCATQKERISGAITDVVVGSHDSMQPLGPRINITTASSAYQAILEAWG